MEIEKINFEECTSLKDLVSFETTDVMPEEITFSNRNWVHSKCYIHIDPKCHTLHGLIVLKDRHGEYDERYFRQELQLFFETNAIKVDFGANQADLIAFTAREQNGIFVNDAKTLIPASVFFGNSKSDTEQRAGQLKKLSHYTKAPNAIKILESKVLLANSLGRYQTEKTFLVNENSRRLFFIICFTKDLDSNEQMWNQFADGHKGCKIDFIFKCPLADAFTLAQPLRCTDSSDNKHTISPKWLHDKSAIPDVYFTSHYSTPAYVNNASDPTSLLIYENGNYSDFTVSHNAGRNVLRYYEYQNEVRLLLQLHSHVGKEIPFIKNVEIPFSCFEIEKIVVTIGKNATKTTRQKIKELHDKESSLFEVVSETK